MVPEASAQRSLVEAPTGVEPVEGSGRDTDIAWAAGLFEGEGTVGWQEQNGRVRVRFAIAMTDEDIVRRFHMIIGAGHVTGPRLPGNGYKPQWRWSATGYDDVVRVSSLLVDYLGDRRRNALERAWHQFANQPDPIARGSWNAARTHCPHGHPYDGDNLVVYPREGSRRCLECQRQRGYRKNRGLPKTAVVPPRAFTKRRAS